MATIHIVEARNPFSCTCCSERVRTCEKFVQVKNKGRQIRGERYCMSCESSARRNNGIREEIAPPV